MRFVILMREIWLCWSFKSVELPLRDDQMLQRMLENREKGFRKDHLVKNDDRALYKQDIVDHVHGRGRIDLCEVYMSIKQNSSQTSIWEGFYSPNNSYFIKVGIALY